MAQLPSHFPYRRAQWERLVRPYKAYPSKGYQRWVPDSHVKLLLALQMLGETCIEGWKGTEQDARRHNAPPDPPWEWIVSEQADQRFFIFNDLGEKVFATRHRAEEWWQTVLPVLVREWEEEKHARSRWLECQQLMRNKLASEDIVAEILQDSGKFERIPPHVWIGEKGGQFLSSGIADIRIPSGYESRSVKGLVVFKRTFLTSPSKLATRSKQHEFTNVPTRPSEQTEPVSLKHFPYLAFMLSAAKNGPFSTGRRVPKKVIEDWLRKNWPRPLGEPTPNKTTNMATLLRRPEDEKGGNH